MTTTTNAQGVKDDIFDVPSVIVLICFIVLCVMVTIDHENMKKDLIDAAIEHLCQCKPKEQPK